MQRQVWVTGADCWAPDADNAFVEAKVVEVQAGGKVVVSVDGHRRQDPVPESELLPRVPGQRVLAEMDDLQALNMATVLSNAETLFGLQQSERPGDGPNTIYSSVGPILIAMNPFQELPLYGPKWIEAYSHDAVSRLPPHCYRSAQDAYMRMQAHRKPQSCVVCGESGAGKTVTNMKMLQYLCEVGKRKDGKRGSLDPQQIIKASELLEAFGNATTGRNDNSSRFGRFTKLNFEEAGGFSVCGCSVDHYLLERSRVIAPPKGERNYHIFYLLARSSLADGLGLGGGPGAFDITREGSDRVIDEFQDASDFERISSQMDLAGLQASEKQLIFEGIAAVIHLGNLKFDGDKDTSSVDPATQDSLDRACSLLGIDAGRLKEALCTSFIKTPGGGQVKKNLSADQARAQRDAVAKTIYAKIFDQIMWNINQKLKRGLPMASLTKLGSTRMKASDKDLVIGLLDIFGFEDMPVNGFEQMFINLTNERIQLLFNQVMFEREAEEYRSQGVPTSIIENLDCVNLLESSKDAVKLFTSVRPPGIVKLLSDQCNLPSGKDGEAFVNVLKGNVIESAGNKFKVCGPQDMRKTLLQKGFTPKEIQTMKYQENFHVQHYAGSVMYTVNDFLAKSRDGLLPHLTDVMTSSAKDGVVDLFSQAASKSTTIGDQFCQQLEVLAEQLESGETMFVRCIKSNMQKAPGSINKKLVLEQLVRGGLVAALEMRQAGFPDRVEYDEFVTEFRCLEIGAANKSVRDLPKLCQETLRNFLGDSADDLRRYTLGKTKLLMKGDVLPFLRNVVIFKTTWWARKVQRFWRVKKRTERIRDVDEAWAGLQELEIQAEQLMNIRSVAAALSEVKGKIGPVHKLLDEARERCGNDVDKLLAVLDPYTTEVVKFRGMVRKVEEDVGRVVARRNEASQLLAARITAAAKQVANLLDTVKEVEEACQETEEEGREEDKAELEKCKAVCKEARTLIENIQKKELPELKKKGPTTFDLEGTAPLDKEKDPAPKATELVASATALVARVEELGQNVGASRRRFLEAVKDTEAERQQARESLESLQEPTRRCISEGLDGIAEKVSASWKCFEQAEVLLNSARDEGAFRAAVAAFVAAVQDATQAVEGGKALLEKREREREERRQLRQKVDTMETELRTMYQSVGEGLELTLAGDAEARRLCRDLLQLLQDLPSLREGANGELEDYREAIQSFSRKSEASLAEGATIWEAASKRKRADFRNRKSMFEGQGAPAAQEIMAPEAFIKMEGAERHMTTLTSIANDIASVQEAGLSKVTLQRCTTHFIKYSYGATGLAAARRGSVP